jgi:hypothetical protein
MGRPTLGTGARNRHAALRVTLAEEQELERRYGSTGKGLRRALDDMKAGWLSPSQAVHDAGVDLAAGTVERMIEAGPAVEAALAEVVEDPLTFGTRVDPEPAVIEAGLPLAGTATAATEGVAVAPGHHHRRGTKIATEFDKGTKVEVWACECGKEMR